MRRILLAVPVMLLAACDGAPRQAEAAPAEKQAAASPAAPQPKTFVLGDSEFEKWEKLGNPVIEKDRYSAPDLTTTVDMLTANLNEGVGKVDNRPVKAGETRSASIYIWGTPGRSVALQLADWCTPTAIEVETVYATLMDTPHEVKISHTYKQDHPCTRFQVLSQEQLSTVIFLWNARGE